MKIYWAMLTAINSSSVHMARSSGKSESGSALTVLVPFIFRAIYFPYHLRSFSLFSQGVFIIVVGEWLLAPLIWPNEPQSVITTICNVSLHSGADGWGVDSNTDDHHAKL